MYMYRMVGLSVVVATLTVASVAFAQVAGPTNVIVPCNGPDCDICDLATLIQNILNFGIYLAVVGSALLFSWAGWLYLSSAENPGQRTQAKNLFMSVLIGLIIIIAAWLVIDTLMRGLVGSTLFGPWNVLC